jgi:hypothetical protein
MQDDWQNKSPDNPAPNPPMPNPIRDPLRDVPIQLEWPDWLADFFAFRLMLTPLLVRILFIIGLPIIVIAAFCYCYEGYNPEFDSGSGRFFAAVLLSAVALPLWRVVCETAIVLFSIHEEIRKP